MNSQFWNALRRLKKKKRGANILGVKKPFSELVRDVSGIRNKAELCAYADSYGLSSDEYEALSGLWDTIKSGVSKAGSAIGGLAKQVWQPIGTAIGQRTKYEVDTAGQRIAAQIMPPSLAPAPMPTVVEQKDRTLDTVVRFAPYVIGGVLLFKLLQRQK